MRRQCRQRLSAVPFVLDRPRHGERLAKLRAAQLGRQRRQHLWYAAYYVTHLVLDRPLRGELAPRRGERLVQHRGLRLATQLRRQRRQHLPAVALSLDRPRGI